MKVHFYLSYSTNYNQSCFLVFDNPQLGDAVPISMKYFNQKYWHILLDLEPGEYNYHFVVKENDKQDLIDFEKNRNINIPFSKDVVTIVDDWNTVGDIQNVFETKAFKILLGNTNNNTQELKASGHLFKVKAPLISSEEQVCIIGSANGMGNWDKNLAKPLILKNGWWQIDLNLEDANFPVYYKFGYIQKATNNFIGFEAGDDRVLDTFADFNNTIIHDGTIHYNEYNWKGAGVAIPVFSLRTKNSCGVGEFLDIKNLADWCETTGLKLIQLLPVNDTTNTYTWQDSYPYSAISAFALHPMYLNLETLLPQNLKETYEKTKTENNLKDVVDYEAVMKYKLDAIQSSFEFHKDSFLNNDLFYVFFNDNKDWLVPYAAFSYLRELYGTSDFSKWESNAVYHDFVIEEFTNPEQEHFDKIAIHYFTQYHLHLQLKEAVAYAHEKAIVIKGDIPIGISACSVDAWVKPELYHMDTQAGAPPDDFAIKGQNWGFPTYNWQQMQKDNFAWWKRRFAQMSEYFDAFRIDHILGFFRIWCIPKDAVEGILGKFYPALPVTKYELEQNSVTWNYERLCKPYINDEIIHQFFGENTQIIKSFFFNKKANDTYEFKNEYNTQVKIANFFEGDEESELKNAQVGLFDLISNVILFDDTNGNGDALHFRISMEQTTSFKYLESFTQNVLRQLYLNYFYKRQDDFWEKEAITKLPELRAGTDMLICGEDLGMVPDCVPGVMKNLSILSLEIQRMPKQTGIKFFNPKNAPYLSVVTPSTHDMSTLRGWWEEDFEAMKIFYREEIGKYDQAPIYCEPWLNDLLIKMHLNSPAMWSIFQLQDLLGSDFNLRRENPNAERINIPANPKHYWQYRMHIGLEDLINESNFNAKLKVDIFSSGR